MEKLEKTCGEGGPSMSDGNVAVGCKLIRDTVGADRDAVP